MNTQAIYSFSSCKFFKANILPSANRRRRGFTLIELLTVMVVMASLLALAGPAVTALKGAGDFTQSTYQISGILEQARTYALSHNTYVYVGFAEVDSTQSGAATSHADGTGKVAVMIAASKDGTRGYDMNNSSGGWTLGASSQLLPISKLILVSNLHLVDSPSLQNTGNLGARPTLDSASYSMLSQSSVTPLSWPLGGSQYTFNKVIQFDPQGVARIQTSNNGDSVPPVIEIGLQQTRGTQIPSNAQQGAVQIAGVSGMVRIYRQ